MEGSGRSVAGRGSRHTNRAAAPRRAWQLGPVITHPKRREKPAKKGKLAEGVEVGGRRRATAAQSLTVPFQTKELAGGENPERAG